MKGGLFFGIVFLMAFIQNAWTQTPADMSFGWRQTKAMQMNRNNGSNWYMASGNVNLLLANDNTAGQIRVPINFANYPTAWTFETWFIATLTGNYNGAVIFHYAVNESVHITVAFGSVTNGLLSLDVFIENQGITEAINLPSPFGAAFKSNAWYHLAISIQATGQSYARLTGSLEHQNQGTVTDQTVTFTGIAPSAFAGASYATFGAIDAAPLGNNVPADYGGVTRKAFVGRIAEIRIWNVYIPPASLQTTLEVPVNSTGLTHLYRFAVHPTNNVATSAAPSTALALRGADTYVVDANVDFLPSLDRAPIGIITNFVTIPNTQSDPVVTIPTFDAFADFASETSTAYFTSSTNALVFTQTQGASAGNIGAGYSVNAKAFIGKTFNLTRAFCGASQANVDIWINGTTLVPRAGVSPLKLKVIWPSIASTITSISSPPTTGGVVDIVGTNFGLAGSFAGAESITLKGTTCASPVVVSSTQIRCTMPQGTGSGASAITICQANPTIPSFSYATPSITQVSAADVTTVRISGSNFNPSTWNSGRDSIVISGGALPAGGVGCTVNQSSVANISCTPAQSLVAGVTYSVNVTIDGLSGTFSFTFSPCNPPCQNGGQCIGLNLCLCTGTSGFGPLCGTPVVCSPECQSGGVCYNAGSSNNSVGTCNCAVSTNPGSDGDCSTRLVESTLSTGAIIGIAVGVGALLIVLVVVIIILAIRRPKRYKSTAIIPVEKKDFTKIIYGEQLDEGTPDKNAGDLESLEKLLVQGNLETVFALNKITAITEADKIAKALVIIFEAHHKTMDLLKAFTTDEVKLTDSAANLFRSNSMVSKMFKFYSRLVGLPYLYKTIAPEIYEIVEKEELHLEVDPEKLEEGSDLDEMRWTLMAESQKILKQILNSVTAIPAPFAELMSHVKSTVVTKFPDNVNTTIGGFIFLRFFCPAISSPEAYGVVEEPPQPNARRLLILITKVLQNLSNDVEFGSKEPYMTKMNDFIITNRPKISDFYVNMEKSRSNAFNAPTLPKNMKAVSLAVISEHFRTNFDKIESKELKQQLDPIIKKE